LPNAAGQTVPTLTFSTEAGLQIFQNNPNVRVTLSVNTTTPTVGQTVTFDAIGTSIPKGDEIEVFETGASPPATLGSPAQTSVSYGPFGFYDPSFAYHPTATYAHAGSVTYGAGIFTPDGALVAAAPNDITVTWSYAPTITLSVTPDAPEKAGFAFQLDAQTGHAKGDHVVFVQSGSLIDHGGSGTLSGNYESDVAEIDYGPQSASAQAYGPTVASESAGTESVEARLENANNVVVAFASVSVTWVQPTPTLTLYASPTQLASGKPATLTVVESGGDVSTIYVHDMSGFDTLDNRNVEALPSGDARGRVTALYNYDGSVTYMAAMPWHGATIDSKSVSAKLSIPSSSRDSEVSYPQPTKRSAVFVSRVERYRQ